MSIFTEKITVPVPLEPFPYGDSAIEDHSFNPGDHANDETFISQMADRLAGLASTAPENRMLISFILFELIENAVKFTLNLTSPITLQTCRRNNHWHLYIENAVTREQWNRMRTITAELQSCPVDELYRQRLSSLADRGQARGLGLLIIMKSPGVILRIIPHTTNQRYRVAVTAVVELSSPHP